MSIWRQRRRGLHASFYLFERTLLALAARDVASASTSTTASDDWPKLFDKRFDRLGAAAAFRATAERRVDPAHARPLRRICHDLADLGVIKYIAGANNHFSLSYPNNRVSIVMRSSPLSDAHQAAASQVKVVRVIAARG